MYGPNPKYFIVCIDTRGASPDVHVRGVKGKATVYDSHKKYLGATTFATSSRVLVPGKVYLLYARNTIPDGAKAYGISAAATIEVTSERSTEPAAAGNGTGHKIYPNVPFVYSAKMIIPGAGTHNVTLLNRPPGKA